MKFIGKDVDPAKLLTRAELFDFLNENGGHDRALARIRERHYTYFGNEMIWRYPISDGKHAGTFIVLIREGFISLPYDTIDSEDYEMLEIEDAAMFTAEDMKLFIDDWTSFSSDLLFMMKDACRMLSARECTNERDGT